MLGTVDIKFLSEGSKTQPKVIAATFLYHAGLLLGEKDCKLSFESSTVVQRAPSGCALRFFFDVLSIFPKLERHAQQIPTASSCDACNSKIYCRKTSIHDRMGRPVLLSRKAK